MCSFYPTPFLSFFRQFRNLNIEAQITRFIKKITLVVSNMVHKKKAKNIIMAVDTPRTQREDVGLRALSG